MNELLAVERLACERDGRTLFRELTFSLGPGQILELTGPNGSGKSTLLRCVAGIYADYQGTISGAHAQYLGHQLGLNGLLTAAENLDWYQAMLEDGAISSPPSNANAKTRDGEVGNAHAGIGVDAALDRVGMAGYGRTPCHELSAGQQRRVALARMLLCPRPLWLLDEPFTALDENGQHMVVGLLQEQARSRGAVLCATHQRLGIQDTTVLELGKSP